MLVFLAIFGTINLIATAVLVFLYYRTLKKIKVYKNDSGSPSEILSHIKKLETRQDRFFQLFNTFGVIAIMCFAFITIISCLN